MPPVLYLCCCAACAYCTCRAASPARGHAGGACFSAAAFCGYAGRQLFWRLRQRARRQAAVVRVSRAPRRSALCWCHSCIPIRFAFGLSHCDAWRGCMAAGCCYRLTLWPPEGRMATCLQTLYPSLAASISKHSLFRLRYPLLFCVALSRGAGGRSCGRQRLAVAGGGSAWNGICCGWTALAAFGRLLQLPS